MEKSPEEIFAEGLGLMEKKAAVLPPPPSKPLPASVPQSQKIITSRGAFMNGDAHPVALDLILLKNFELEWLEWLPDTLFFEIEQTFTTSVAEVNKLKILAIQTLHVVDTFWEAWEIFEKTVWALNGQVPMVNIIQPPDLSMLYAGVAMANDIRRETYGEEVARYCAAVFLHENVLYAPAPLTFCQEYITQPTYTCQDCGKVGSTLPPFDGMCTSCGKHFESEHPFSFKPDPDAIKRGAGQKLTMGKTYDPEPTKARFEVLNNMSAEQLKTAIRETPEDIEAAKLITAVDFVKHRDQQLAEQLSTLRGWLETA